MLITFQVDDFLWQLLLPNLSMPAELCPFSAPLHSKLKWKLSVADFIKHISIQGVNLNPKRRTCVTSSKAPQWFQRQCRVLLLFGRCSRATEQKVVGSLGEGESSNTSNQELTQQTSSLGARQGCMWRTPFALRSGIHSCIPEGNAQNECTGACFKA